ncbi:MAG: hypothetical protein IJ737_02480 [Ruminococcus sp.]|nr:hypothetical protein [Ruminococcus sp.]
MNKAVGDFIEKKNKLRAREIEYKKRKFVEEWSINDRIYAPDEQNTSDFPFFDKKENRHYKTVPAVLTDEEYEAAKNAEEALQREFRGKSYSAVIIKIIAYLIWCIGIFGALIAASGKGGNNGFSAKIFFIIFSASLLSGLMLWALGEIIRLLNEIKEKKN